MPVHLLREEIHELSRTIYFLETIMSFNAESFMSESFDGPMSTEYKVIPEDEYVLEIQHQETDDLDSGRARNSAIHVRSGESEREDGTTRAWAILNIPMKILKPTDPEVDGKFVRKSIFLDLVQDQNDPRHNQMDTGEGRNVELGRLRAAAGQNVPGPWNPKMLAGQKVVGRVKHRADRNDPERIYAEVHEVAAYTG